MTSRVRRLARGLTPPAVTDALSGRSRHLTRFDDTVGTWAQAQEATDADDWGEVVERVAAAMAEVRAGRAALERDGVALAEPEVRWPVIASLLRQAALDSFLRVVDYGGSLGSLYWQHAQLLDGLDVAWGVVEQPVFVDRGRSGNLDPVTFHGTLDEAVESIKPNVILFSSVLQYLPDPHAVLRAAGASGARAIVLDRTTVIAGPTDRPSIQIVPPALYAASYPAWLLSEDQLAADLPGWSLAAAFPGIEPASRTASGIDVHWIGATFTRS